MDYICCITGESFFDVWTVVHTTFWIFIGSCLWAFKVDKLKVLLVCTIFALAWEAFEEFVAFKLWPDHWLDPESWWNSWISDPLTCIVGILFIYAALDNRPRRKSLL